MDNRTRELKGSPHRDAFKHWHKKLNKQAYALDLDLVWIVKRPRPGVVAIVDYKRSGEGVTFAEVVAYNDFVSVRGIPVYLISTFPLQPPYISITVREYIWGDPKPYPPTYQTSLILDSVSPDEFERWQMNLRRQGPALVNFSGTLDPVL